VRGINWRRRCSSPQPCCACSVPLFPRECAGRGCKTLSLRAEVYYKYLLLLTIANASSPPSAGLTVEQQLRFHVLQRVHAEQPESWHRVRIRVLRSRVKMSVWHMDDAALFFLNDEYAAFMRH